MRTSLFDQGVVVTDGAGDRYQVVDYAAVFRLRSLDDPRRFVDVSSATLATLGLEWDGRRLKECGA